MYTPIKTLGDFNARVDAGAPGTPEDLYLEFKSGIAHQAHRRERSRRQEP